jgi:hypothetical protein
VALEPPLQVDICLFQPQMLGLLGLAVHYCLDPVLPVPARLVLCQFLVAQQLVERVVQSLFPSAMETLVQVAPFLPLQARLLISQVADLLYGLVSDLLLLVVP